MGGSIFYYRILTSESLFFTGQYSIWHRPVGLRWAVSRYCWLYSNVFSPVDRSRSKGTIETHWQDCMSPRTSHWRDHQSLICCSHIHFKCWIFHQLLMMTVCYISRQAGPLHPETAWACTSPWYLSSYCNQLPHRLCNRCGYIFQIMKIFWLVTVFPINKCAKEGSYSFILMNKLSNII